MTDAEKLKKAQETIALALEALEAGEVAVAEVALRWAKGELK